MIQEGSVCAGGKARKEALQCIPHSLSFYPPTAHAPTLQSIVRRARGLPAAGGARPRLTPSLGRARVGAPLRAVFRGMESWDVGPLLGEGGASGRVHLGRHRTYGLFAALKFLRAGVRGKDLRKMVNLCSTRLLALLDYFTVGSGVVLVLQLAPRGSLLELMLPPLEALDEVAARTYAVQLVEALVELHDMGIAHGDLKPENLLLDGDMTLMLSAFDCAQWQSDWVGQAPWHTGTAMYTAPELTARTYCPDFVDRSRSDMWSVGVVIFSLVTGLLPFDGPACPYRQAVLEGDWGTWLRNMCPRKGWDAKTGLLHTSPGLLQLLRGLLEVDPSIRLTSRQCQDNAWMRGPTLQKKELQAYMERRCADMCGGEPSPSSWPFSQLPPCMLLQPSVDISQLATRRSLLDASIRAVLSACDGSGAECAHEEASSYASEAPDEKAIPAGNAGAREPAVLGSPFALRPPTSPQLSSLRGGHYHSAKLPSTPALLVAELPVIHPLGLSMIEAVAIALAGGPAAAHLPAVLAQGAAQLLECKETRAAVAHGAAELVQETVGGALPLLRMGMQAALGGVQTTLRRVAQRSTVPIAQAVSPIASSRRRPSRDHLGS